LAVELLIAPPATGKTETVIQRIITLKKSQPFAKIWVVVPDRLQTVAFRRRLAHAGGTLGTQVGRFTDLFNNILEENGIFMPRATYPLTHHLIKGVVDQAVQAGQIPYYKGLQDFPGFIQILHESFTELKRALVEPHHLMEYVQNGTPGQRELALLYQHYQSRLQTLQYADEEDINNLTVRKLQDKSITCQDIEMLVVDGFDSFTGAQFAVLKLLASQVKTLLINFPGDCASQRPAHHRFGKPIQRLLAEFNPRLLPANTKTYLPPAISHIEKHLFNNEESPSIPVKDPILLEARSPTEEVREALRWVKKLVLRQQIPISDCVIFTPNPNTYHPLLRLFAEEFGIHLRFTLDESLDNSPPITAIINLLSLPLKKFNTHHLINSLRSPYFDFALQPETIDMLEMISRIGQIVEGQDQWQETFARLIDSTDEERANLDDERNAPKLPRGQAANQLKLQLDTTFQHLTPPAQSLTQTQWISWLEDLLDQLDFYARSDNDRDRTATQVFRDVLRSLVLVESVIGAKQVSYESFINDFFSTLQSKGAHEPFQRNQPELLIARLTEARGIRYKAVAILGLSEGSFPVNEQPDPFLDETIRQNLGLEPRLNREQAGLYYQAVTRADQFLLITRPYLSSDGEIWEESPYWSATKKLFDSSVVERVNSDQPLPLIDAASTQELLFEAVRTRKLPTRYDFLLDRWKNLQQVREVLHARRSKEVKGPYEGDLTPVSDTINQRYSPDAVWSASRLETYSNCPYQFFVSNLLELEARELPKLGLDSRQLGSMLHKILENTYLYADDRSDLDNLLATLEKECEKEFANAPTTYGFRPSVLWQIEQEQLREKLRETITALAKEANWTPTHFEAKFGLDGVPPLTIDLQHERIKIRGLIDRIDRNPQGNLRVIDYKSGSSHLAANDLKLGYRLQLPVYALAARDALQLGNVIDGFYWKIQQAEAGSLRLERFSNDDVKGIEVAFETLLQHLEHILAGIRSADFPPQPPQGGCPSYCPAAQWCWRYTPGW
jgi:ATP-dependent helicase/DNAse subunit B